MSELGVSDEPSTAIWRDVRRVFESVVDLPGNRRDRSLRAACEGKPQLEDRVQRLLVIADEGSVAIDRGALGLLQAPHASPDPADLGGQVAAGYTLVRRVASGGMGEVWLAERPFGASLRRVAVKVLKPGVDTDALLRRFRVEQEALASLHHDNIVAFLDAGLFADGRPFLVMEYVDGLPITRYCRQHKLDGRHRLSLFLDVCAAVQFAHARLVLHRDLKPSNIFVSATGTPKLLDFGVAKMLETEADDVTSEHGVAAAWTVQYASPEQIQGQPPSALTDVYGLGLVLYELMAGRAAFGDRTMAQLWQTRRESFEPPAPSVALQPTSDGTNVPFHVVHGDLDAVCLRAIHPDPSRRYASVDAFAADVRRVLAGEPVLARRASWFERAGKWVRRHRAVSTGLGLVAMFLLTASLGTWMGMRRAQEDAHRGWGAHADSRRATRFLETMLVEQAAGTWAPSSLDGRVATQLERSPEAEALVRIALGRERLEAGDASLALDHLTRAVQLGRRDGVVGRHELARALCLLGRAEAAADMPVAEHSFRESVALYRTLKRPDALGEFACRVDLAWVLAKDPTRREEAKRIAADLERESTAKSDDPAWTDARFALRRLSISVSD